MQQTIAPKGRSVLDELNLGSAFVAKAKLAIQISKSIAEMKLSQREAAKRLPLSQPKLSLVIRGKLDGISQAMLEECLQALGHDIEIKISRRHEGVGQLRVLEDA